MIFITLTFALPTRNFFSSFFVITFYIEYIIISLQKIEILAKSISAVMKCFIMTDCSNHSITYLA